MNCSQSMRALFEPLSARASASNKDALEEYLGQPPIDSIKDPIAYWDQVCRTAKASRGLQALARMAFDFLTVPGTCPRSLCHLHEISNIIQQATSTDAERAFSRGGLTVSRLRHSLKDASVRASALVASWSRIPGLVPEKETVALLKSTIRKSRGKGANRDDAPGGEGGKPSASGERKSSGASGKQVASTSASKTRKAPITASASKKKHRAANSNTSKASSEQEDVVFISSDSE